MSSQGGSPTKKTEFQVEILWRVVIVGLLGLSTKLSWEAWKSSQAQVGKNTEAVAKASEALIKVDTRLTYVEREIGALRRHHEKK